tara:strand:- start:606 stop:1310 length:705 start_codon:yes stop_codon:yes gene_type:complete
MECEPFSQNKSTLGQTCKDLSDQAKAKLATSGGNAKDPAAVLGKDYGAESADASLGDSSGGVGSSSLGGGGSGSGSNAVSSFGSAEHVDPDPALQKQLEQVTAERKKVFSYEERTQQVAEEVEITSTKTTESETRTEGLAQANVNSIQQPMQIVQRQVPQQQMPQQQVMMQGQVMQQQGGYVLNGASQPIQNAYLQGPPQQNGFIHQQGQMVAMQGQGQMLNQRTYPQQQIYRR